MIITGLSVRLKNYVCSDVFLSTSCVAISSCVHSGDLSCSHFPRLLPLFWETPGTLKHNNPDYYNNIRHCTWLRTKPNGTTGSDKSPAIKSSKIFSLPNHKGTLLPVLETVSPIGSLFSINLVSCVTGHFYGEKKKQYSLTWSSHSCMFTVVEIETVSMWPNWADQVNWTGNEQQPSNWHLLHHLWPRQKHGDGWSLSLHYNNNVGIRMGCII